MTPDTTEHEQVFVRRLHAVDEVYNGHGSSN